MPDPFIIIGENIHTTRALRRSGQRITTDPDGAEAVSFRAAQGERRYLLIPGRVKHVQIALRAAMAEPTTTQAEPHHRARRRRGSVTCTGWPSASTRPAPTSSTSTSTRYRCAVTSNRRRCAGW